MARRKPEIYFELNPYTDGFMNDRMNAGNLPTKGCPEHHLPDTAPGEVEIDSAFAIAKSGPASEL